MFSFTMGFVTVVFVCFGGCGRFKGRAQEADLGSTAVKDD